MNKAFVGLFIGLGFLVPAFASASVTITSVTLNGGAYGNGHYLQVNPGDPITVTVTADLTNKSKWKGTGWGINTTAATPTCVNTKNRHARQLDLGRNNSWYGGDDRDDDHFGFWWIKRHSDHGFDDDHETNSTYSITFSIFAPRSTGLYNANFMPDGKNNCGWPVGPLFTLPNAILVGQDTSAPVIAPHSDVLVTVTDLAATGSTVTYVPPTVTDDIDANVPVSCSPASGSFFPLGSTVVSCFAHDSAGNMAMPVSFNVTVAFPPDMTPPVIAPHADILVQTADQSGAVVSYVLPLATDDRNGSVPVSCTPASGSTFALGTTTVLCTASDAASNTASSTFAVVVTQDIVVPPTDTQAPVIEAHADMYATTTGTTTVVSYVSPAATDNVDATVAVSCAPASGSTFALGTTTVVCQAEDAAGNPAESSFAVVVEQEVVDPPALYTMASQPDQSYPCGVLYRTWRYCDEVDFSWGFTENFGPLSVIDLGVGSDMGTGILQTVTIAKDAQTPTEESDQFFNPWDITISCFTNSSHTTSCGDWAPIVDDANVPSGGKYWTADFSSFNRTFKQDGYYTMTIDDTGWEAAVFGSESLQEPYWEILGIE